MSELTQQDVWRRDLSEQISHARGQVKACDDQIEDLNNEKKEIEAARKKWCKELDRRVDQLIELENGTYQPGLFTRIEDPPSEDSPEDSGEDHPDVSSPDAVSGTPALEAAAKLHREASGDSGRVAPLAVLIEYGLTEKQVEMFQSSDLAANYGGLKTVSDLERAIAADEWWHKQVKGIGESRVDKIVDAITAYRSSHPIVTEDDGDQRVKQCGQCEQVYSPRLEICPQCGESVFELVDPPDKAEDFDEPDKANDGPDPEQKTEPATEEPQTEDAPFEEDYALCNDPEGESPFLEDYLFKYLVPEDGSPVEGTSIKVAVYTAQSHEGPWYACCHWQVGDKSYGRTAPLKTSRPHDTEDEACVTAVDELMDWFSEHQPEGYRKVLDAVNEFRSGCLPQDSAA